MLSKLHDALKNAKIDHSTRETLQSVLEWPEVKNVINTREAETLEERRKLIEELKAIPSKFKKQLEESGERCKRSSKALEAANAALMAAQKEDGEARSLANAIQSQENRARCQIEAMLIKGCDSRLKEFRLYLGNLYGSARCSHEYWVTTEKRLIGYETKYHSNSDDVKNCMAALEKALTSIEEAGLAAMSFDEITVLLKRLCGEIEKPLALLELTPPTIEESGKVKEPLNWRCKALVSADLARERSKLN